MTDVAQDDRQSRLGEWRPHLESNQELTLRKGSLYPFNYGAELQSYLRHFSAESQFVTGAGTAWMFRPGGSGIYKILN